MTLGRPLSSIACGITALLLLNQIGIGQQLSWAKKGTGSGMAFTALADGGCVVIGMMPLGSTSAIFGPGEANETTLTTLFWYPPYQALLQNVGLSSVPRIDLYVAKYSPDGLLQWVRQITPYLFSSGVFAGGPSVDRIAAAPGADGSFLIYGSLLAPIVLGVGDPNETITSVYGNPTYTGMDKMFVAKYSATGSLEWARSEGGGESGQGIEMNGGAISPDGSVLVTGSYWGTPLLGTGTPAETTLPDDPPAGVTKMFLAKYSPTGDLTWVKTICNGWAQGVGITAHADGSCIVTGSAWYDTSWQSFPTAGLGEPNETVLTSTAASTDTNWAFFVAKYDTSGSLLWAKQGIQDNIAPDYAEAIGRKVGATPDGGGVVIGSLRGSITLGAGESNQTTLESTTTNLDDCFVARYQATGQLLWAKRIASTHRVRISSASTTSDASTILGGWSFAPTILGAGEPGETTLPGGSFVARYRADGSLAWAKNGWENVAAFADGACIVQLNAGPGTFTFGAGEPNETSLTFTASDGGALMLRLRGDTTELTAATPTEPGVPVVLSNGVESDGGIEVAFSDVGTPGTITATVMTEEPAEPLPASFDLAGNQWYQITADPPVTSPNTATICIEYDENGIADESTLRLMHYENEAWVDVTIPVPGSSPPVLVDTVNNRIYGETTSLSPFAVVVRSPLAISATSSVISAFGGSTTLEIYTDGTVPDVWIATGSGILQGINPLIDQGGGYFRVELLADSQAGGATVMASAGSASASVEVRFVPVDLVNSSVTVDPVLTFQNGVATVSVDLRDDVGQPVSGVGSVVIATSSGVLQGSVFSQQAGVFTQQLLADQAPVTAQITATVDGLPLDSTAALTVLDPTVFAAFGLDGNATSLPYATIQEAVNHVATDGLVGIAVAPGNHRELVKVAGLANLVIEGCAGSVPVSVQGFRLDRCQQVTLSGFTIDATDSNAPGIAMAGGQNGNADIAILDCLVRNTRVNQPGIGVGPLTGALLVQNCAVLECGGNGIDLAQGGPFTVDHCTITSNGWNGIAVDKDSTVTIAYCTITHNGRSGDSRRGYGILRQRAPGGGSPSTIVLLGNTLADNCGLVVPGRSDAQVGNYDQVTGY